MTVNVYPMLFGYLICCLYICFMNSINEQKGYAKMVTNMLKGREYIAWDEHDRITFRIANIIPPKDVFKNVYGLRVEIINVEKMSIINGGWATLDIYKGERVPKYFMDKYKKFIKRELGVFLNIFGLSFNIGDPKFACIMLELPKVINRKDDGVLPDIITNQSVDRKACRKNMNDYFISYNRI